jgi:hypothetical protein
VQPQLLDQFATGHTERHLELGKAGFFRSDARRGRQEAAAQCGTDPHAQEYPAVDIALLVLVDGLVELAQQVVGEFEPVLARRRQADRARTVAVDQLRTESFFKLGQLLTDRRL